MIQKNIITFEDVKFTKETEVIPMVGMIHKDWAIVEFDNGYAASIIHGSYTYDLELAVMVMCDDDTWRLTYETPITGDVCGYLEEEEVSQLLVEIKALPKPEITDPDHYCTDARVKRKVDKILKESE
tara:strand:- start:28 stop:408 length:381 start_codon:yes stop_codon:yes gene_type:complete